MKTFKTPRLPLALLFTTLLASCGGGGGGGSTTPTPEAKPSLSLVAGALGGQGFLDGDSTTARLYSPKNVLTDEAGNAYLLDGTTIRRVSAQGVISTLIAPSVCADDVDGPAGTACVSSWFDDIARDTAGNFYVSSGSTATIRKVGSDRAITTFAGKLGERGQIDGPLATARLAWPTSMVFGHDGSLYFADRNTVRKISPAGVVSTLAGQGGVSGSGDGTGAAARFVGPGGIAVDADDNLYVTDGNGLETVRKVTPAGVVTTLANTKAAGCQSVRKLVVDSTGAVFATSSYSICKITPAGVVSLFAGSATQQQGNADGLGTAASFESAGGIAFDPAGRLMVADESTLRRITPDGNVTHWVGASMYGAYADGSFARARFSAPAGITSDAAGNLYVADSGNHSIRKLAGGQVTTLAGSPNNRTVIDGTGAAAGFNDPLGITVDAQGNVFVADTYRHVIRKITPQGVTTTFAGANDQHGHVDATGGAARLAYPNDLVADATGNLYVTDRNNYGIRKITPAGVVTTLAGGGRGTSDGTGAAATFDEPAGIAIDGAGNLYVGDTGLIRKVTPAGVVTTLAGGGPDQLGLTDGQGAAARFERYLTSLAVDADGNVYAADHDNGVVRKITPGGKVSTLIGVRDGFAGVVPGTLPARLNTPYGVHVVGRTLYITDEHVVLSVSLP